MMMVMSFQFKEVPKPIPEGMIKTGQMMALSQEGSNWQLAAVVKNVTADQVFLELLKPIPGQSFHSGEKIRAKLWDYDESFYCDSEIRQISGPSGLVISRPTQGSAVQRKKAYTVFETIHFSVTVAEAGDPQLVGKQLADIETSDISAGGLEFETDLPLKAHDKLRIHLRLLPSQEIDVVASVVVAAAKERDGKPVQVVSLKFIDMSPHDQNQLLLFLAQTSPEKARFDIPWVG